VPLDLGLNDLWFAGEAEGSRRHLTMGNNLVEAQKEELWRIAIRTMWFS
jgi:hypothetical protein